MYFTASSVSTMLTVWSILWRSVLTIVFGGL